MLDVLDLKSRMATCRWFHTIDLGRGVSTPGELSAEYLAAEAAALFDPVVLCGRSLLDVGAWNGYFSFEAKRRGATVLATDSYCWTEPHIRGLESFRLCREELGLDVADQLVDVDDLSSTVEPHDVVLFAGVLYHRIDPVRAIASVAQVTRHLLILETHQDALDIGNPAMILYPGRELNDDPTNWWGPNTRCVDGLLRSHGFEAVFYRDGPPPAGRQRGIFHAFKSRSAVSELAPSVERHSVDLSVAPPWPRVVALEQRLANATMRLAELERLANATKRLAELERLATMRLAELERLVGSRSWLLKHLIRTIARKALG